MRVALPQFADNVALAERTTLGIGGPCRYFARIERADDWTESCAWARRRGVPLWILGGGSNVVIADEGLPGLVLQPGSSACEVRVQGDTVVLDVGAGHRWDALVERAVAEGWAGIECLSGIPGLVGAAPMQNIGAYGQEVREVIAAVAVADRTSGQVREIEGDACGFGYRTSHFKGPWREHYVVLGLRLCLRKEGLGRVRYPELVARLGGATAPVAAIREAVLAIRRSKSMVYDPGDPNHRSCGSFFMNPIVADSAAESLVRAHPEMPRFPAGDGRTKLAAAWLIEKAGFAKGYRRGAVGLSTQHALAIVNHGLATAADIVRFAGEIRAAVRDAFAIELQPEPEFLGFGVRPPL